MHSRRAGSWARMGYGRAGGYPGNVHLSVAPPPTARPSDLVKVLKGVSARILLKEFPDLAQRARRGTLWAPSYFIASAGNVSAETIERYIREQTEGG